ncbi:MAG: hypothetical protein KDJ37_11115 [Hyphomicrobiaceae bacterium]|nr:hypothetical protein [Hyphomicrobiaceae bacterium]
MPRLDAPERDAAEVMPDDMRHALSLDEVGNIYASRGFPRSQRSLQRFCAGGHLDCQKVATTTGDKYLVAPYSVERHLTQLKQLAATAAATGRDVSRQFATPVVPQNIESVTNDTPRHEERQPAPGADMTAHVAEERRDTSQLVAQLEMRIGEKDDEIKFLRGEVATKNKQLADASERDRETNILIQGLQSMVLKLTGNHRLDRFLPRAERDHDDGDIGAERKDLPGSEDRAMPHTGFGDRAAS